MSRVRVTLVAPRIAWRSPRSRFFTGSLAAHLAFSVGLIWIPTWWRGPVLPPDALTVELVGALPEPAPVAAASTDTSRAEKPEPPTEDITLATPPPVQPKATPRPTPKPTPRPAAASPRPAATPAAPPLASPGPAPGDRASGAPTAGSAASGGSVSALEGLDNAFGWYRSAVTQALYARWQRPLVAGLTARVEVRVGFQIQRDGSVRGLRIEQPSGVPILDRSALRAVSDASPLPPLPAGVAGPFLPASYVFRLYPEGD